MDLTFGSEGTEEYCGPEQKSPPQQTRHLRLHPYGRNQTPVNNLLEALNMTGTIKGVSKVQGEEPGTYAYKFRSRSPHLTLPKQYSFQLVSLLQGSMGFHLVARQGADSTGTLLSVSSSSSLLLQLSSSTRSKYLRLDHQVGTGGPRLASIQFPGGSPFSKGGWVRLALGLEAERVSLFVECREVVVIRREGEERMGLQLAPDAVITLASTPGDIDSKFTGYVQTAELSTRAYERRPWHCENVTDSLLTSGLTHQQDKDTSQQHKHSPHLHDHQEPQSDQPQRGVVVLGPPAPQGVKTASQAQGENRLKGLEERLEGLERMLDMMKAQNVDLQERVQYLEGCECVRPGCKWEGRKVEEGQRWETQQNTFCTCTSGEVMCSATTDESCVSQPCRNGGVCFSSHLAGFRCLCPPNTTGTQCDTHLTQACWQPRPEGSCSARSSPQHRWFFNSTHSQCDPFLFCKGNSNNNFLSLKSCEEQCMMGACCFRLPKPSTLIGYNSQGNSNHDYNTTSDQWKSVRGQNMDKVLFAEIGDKSTLDKDGSDQFEQGFRLSRPDPMRARREERERRGEKDAGFSYSCDYLSVSACQSMVSNLQGEPLRFSPGQHCSEVGCSQACDCSFQGPPGSYKEGLKHGCEECDHSGVMHCGCSQVTQRKEIRDLTLRERRHYQLAVRRLYTQSGVWDHFTKLRAEFSPQAGGHAYFLPWQRYFLWLVEQELKVVSSCQLGVPYFEWTVDSGDLLTSAAWQAGMFGGNGEEEGDGKDKVQENQSVPGCVHHHAFQSQRFPWSPCLRRNFNTSQVSLPDAVSIQRLLSHEDFLQFSQALQGLSGLFRLWVGGHMASPLAAYDPVYLSHIAFMDKLWVQWQERHRYLHTQYPARHHHVNMKPFGITPDDVMSSREQLCVVYVPITLGAPCNVTSSTGANVTSSTRAKRGRGQHKVSKDTVTHHKNRQNTHGNNIHRHSPSDYNTNSHDEFDNSGYNHNGYDRHGFDRMGWDQLGYGRDGLDRDHIDREGYDVFGYNRYGFNRSNVTWFGMSWDGMFMREKGEETEGENGVKEEEIGEEEERNKIMAGLFSNSGYSVYGFDPFGLDRGGFDVFGFRPDSYDKDRCNWFYNGPHYLRFYYHTQQQLSSNTQLALDNIRRNCPPITALPLHWPLQDWMAMHIEESKALVDQLTQEWAGQKQSDEEDTQWVRTWKGWDIWLPITPDNRFCFELHWFSGCPVGSPPITCPDLCREARCHGCKLDGSRINTINGCQTCTCKEGIMLCAPLPCPSLDCSDQENLRGDCCPRCRGCVHTGTRYDHGAQWRAAEQPCSVCQCLEGVVKCETEVCCPPCQHPASPTPNTCCPVCDGCGMNGQDFLNGTQVPSKDPCQECVCVKGDVHCSALPCPVISCQNPVQRPGDCCPWCDQCEYDSQVLQNGETFTSRTDPCVRCRCSAGQVSCEHMEASCPPLYCSHPAKPRGQCCPTCNQCEYGRRVYADGVVFNPAGSGPCVQCSCEGGNVRCREERCPPVQCSNPSTDPQLCCPVCKVCVLDRVEYEEGSQWQVEGCSTCTCRNGEVLCAHTHCPPTTCTHSTKTTDSCCAECDRCTLNHRIYSNRQTFTHPDQPCHTCTCLEGTIQCVSKACPPVNCSKTHTPHGECCPKCLDCSFENRVFVDGEVFPSPVRMCEECVCVAGRVDCHATDCSRPHCTAPLPGTCCQNNCNGCSYAGKEYPNGQEFPHPTDNCRTCHCMNGNVQCLMRRCPILGCSNPNLLPGDCCPQCPAPPADCVYEGQSYRHTERFYDPADPCRSCVCTNGTTRCQRKPCAIAHCSHPIQQDCCRTCDGCLYEGRERVSGESWGDVSDPCGVCVCQQGSVRCERKRCPVLSCPYPIQRDCCLACDGCMYGGQEYHDGHEFLSGTDPCQVCTCYAGDVVCSQLPCYQECTHPYKPPGQCCGECDRCSHGNTVLISGQSTPDPTDPCSECTCQGGFIRCVKKWCPPASCSHPATSPCGCPICDGCVFQGGAYVDGQVFPGTRGTCDDCTCSRGDVVCMKRRCPAVSCPHPALDGCECPVCDGCRFNGRDCFSGDRFPHPLDHCQRCTCLNGGVVCVAGSCPPLVCERPVVPPGECCPICTGVCLYQGEEYQSGTSFTPQTDPCSTCKCVNEVVTCHKKQCPVQCSHPLPSQLSNGCCPLCESCLYEGVVYSDRETFTPRPELANPCQQCSCVRGSVACVPLLCPLTSCPRPITQPGECCPTCAVCVYDAEQYSEGQQWTPSNNPCSACTCQGGKVQCVAPACPQLTCIHQLTEPGSCCPRCRGCVYDGQLRPEGSSWFADSTPCMSCMCVDGVTTCSELRCLSPCMNTFTVPGDCCPVCADCVFEGRVYGPGDSFHPADDPCHICTCEVMPDGDQHLKCYRKQCPSLVDCPKSNIQFSGPDTCCPVCAQPLSNCTATLIGNEVLATDDPCFTCQCKDLSWTCLHQSCPTLSCPPEGQHTPPDSCCPICHECVIEGGKRRVSNGGNWTDSEDECITCTCNLGHIECSIEECVPKECEQGLIRVKTPGKCCYDCQDSGLQCVYQGSIYQLNEQWEVDECTSCSCVFGDVQCYRQRCPPLRCAADESPAVIPGVCCPHCIPRPATCVAFGDPHYRTFDGRMLHFQGACTYVLAQDCEGGEFSIHVTNDDRGRKGVSWTKEVTVLIGDVVVQLLQDWVVKVDYKVITLPFLKEPYIYLERQTNTILLNTNIGLKVLWSGRSHLEVSVPGSFKGHTCGLCGNFNNYPQDDLRTPSGKVSQSEAAFGNSWKVGIGNSSLSSCQPGEDVDPCKAAGYQAKKLANARCRVLKSAAFQACHQVVAPEPWYAACVYDLCACGANADECLCDALEAYAARCREAGAPLSWRSSSLCAVGCPAERGFVFDECGPPCPVTCVNRDVPLGVIESHCFKPCVPGCQCPAGLVLHNNYCIPPETCPSIRYVKS
ncbi:hypothetical protein UPYG_G00265780 [Umbra pygmaea]|uniref:Kielin/chordin-like protein n=1 Tax=Umbra pygmaea TaxID=75934 RepID=A0ABD0WA59_UMBPY